MSAPLYDKTAARARISLLERQARDHEKAGRPVQARSCRQSIHVLQALWSIKGKEVEA
jgi:hypothetical protein